MKLKLGFSFISVVAILYITDVLVDLTIEESLRHDIIVALTYILIGGAAAIFLSFTLTRNLKELTKNASIISQGDLTQKPDVRCNDEIGELAQSFNKMLESLTKLIHEVKTTSDQVNEMARRLSAAMEEMHSTTDEVSRNCGQITRGAESQAEMVKKTSEIMHTLATSTTEISEKAKLASSLASRASSKANQGGHSARLASAKINDMAKNIERASQNVDGFRERALEINKIVEFITTVSQQTHLLALNASIEAAKVGDEGKGFAIVAEEIRKLAENVRSLAEQISKIAIEINTESTDVVQAMEGMVKSMSEGKAVVQTTVHTLEDIIQSVESTSDKMQEITIHTEKQTKGADSLVKTIDEIANIAVGNVEGTEQTSHVIVEQNATIQELSTSAIGLAKTSDQLRDLISLFRIH
jgi:methyl-accepting chemotaxis protein